MIYSVPKTKEHTTIELKKELFEIALRTLYGVEERGDLEHRFNDSEDFLDVSVWGFVRFWKKHTN